MDCGCNALVISKKMCEELSLKTFERNTPPGKDTIGRDIHTKSIITNFFKIEFNGHTTWEMVEVQEGLSHEIYIFSGYLQTYDAKGIVSGNLRFKCNWKYCYSNKPTINSASTFQISYDQTIVFDREL